MCPYALQYSGHLRSEPQRDIPTRHQIPLETSHPTSTPEAGTLDHPPRPPTAAGRVSTDEPEQTPPRLDVHRGGWTTRCVAPDPVGVVTHRTKGEDILSPTEVGNLVCPFSASSVLHSPRSPTRTSHTETDGTPEGVGTDDSVSVCTGTTVDESEDGTRHEHTSVLPSSASTPPVPLEDSPRDPQDHVTREERPGVFCLPIPVQK